MDWEIETGIFRTIDFKNLHSQNVYKWGTKEAKVFASHYS
jgi:hypothetical protein